MRMKRIVIILAIIGAFALLLASCGKDIAKERQKQLEEQLSKIRFKADSLMDYCVPIERPGGTLTYQPLKRSEIDSTTVSNSKEYLNCLVIGLVRTNFQFNDKNVSVEMAQFASSYDAYGFYSQRRPNGVPLDSMGAESYLYNDTLRFTKVDYVVTVTSDADSNAAEIIREIGKRIDSNLTVMSRPPQLFILFPYKFQIVPSQRYYSRNFLGVEGLDNVYTIDYAIDEDTLTLFLSMDTTSNKLELLSEWGASFGKVNSFPKEFAFESKQVESFTHPELGQFVAGMVNNKLAGVIGYNRPTGIQIAPRWIQGLQ